MTAASHSSVTTRIAPSPTGDPHLGTAYQALFNYVFARQHQGRFVVRLEDTDRARYNAGSEDKILDLLDWLELTPDASPRHPDDLGPYVQSERAATHRALAERLVQQGRAYRAFDTPQELEERRRAAEAAGGSYRGYDRRDRELSAEESDRRAAAGEPFVIRLKVPLTGQTVVRDRLRGEVVFGNAELDDKVLLKADGFPTYHLAAMADDHLMGVTHVIRAEEWLVSTPIHILILQALGWEPPEWIHTSFLLGKGGKKLSKRRGDAAANSYIEMGVLREALLNYLGMMGWTMPPDPVSHEPREVFSVQDMIEHFSWERVSLGGSIFDLDKLRWLNGKYIREVLTPQQLRARLHSYLAERGFTHPDDEYFGQVALMMTPRMELLSEFLPKTEYFWSEDYPVSEKAQRQIAEGQDVLRAARERLSALPDFEQPTTDAALRALAEQLGVKPGKVMQPLRAALAGTTESPGMFEMLQALGRERVLGRLDRALRE